MKFKFCNLSYNLSKKLQGKIKAYASGRKTSLESHIRGCSGYSCENTLARSENIMCIYGGSESRGNTPEVGFSFLRTSFVLLRECPPQYYSFHNNPS